MSVLHNPDASISSQDPPHWQVIFVPQYAIMSLRFSAAFVPLNSTEIAILGGYRRGKYFSDVFTFNTSTNEFNKREVEEGALSFMSYGN